MKRLYAPRRFKPKPGTPGGEWTFTWGGKHYVLSGRYIQDATSPSDDGLRWIASSESVKFINQLVHKIANGQCELKLAPNCWKWAPHGAGHPHHVRHKKMGGAFTDDRIWISIAGEPTQIRIWACPSCHRNHHNRLHWSRRENIA
jgi:hypothetical protein